MSPLTRKLMLPQLPVMLIASRSAVQLPVALISYNPDCEVRSAKNRNSGILQKIVSTKLRHPRDGEDPGFLSSKLMTISGAC